MPSSLTPSVSVCTIIKDEAMHLKEYFSSIIDFCDEIVVVDTGSTDRGVEIVKSYEEKNPGKVKFFSFTSDGIFHYGKAKNYSIEQATKDYILVLDADERPEEDFFPKLKGFLALRRPEVATIVRQDQTVPHLIEKHERIIKNGLNIFYGTDEESRLHEHLVHPYKAQDFDGLILHCQGKNHWVVAPQRILFQMGLEIERTPKTKSFLGHFLRGLWAFQWKFRRVYFKQRIYKDGWVGLKFAFMRGLYAFLVQLFVGLKPKKS